jgi:hypothetical protein
MVTVACAEGPGAGAPNRDREVFTPGAELDAIAAERGACVRYGLDDRWSGGPLTARALRPGWAPGRLAHHESISF